MAKFSLIRPENRRNILAGSVSVVLLSVGVGVMAANGWLPRAAFISAVEKVPEIAVPVSARAETETQVTPTPVATPERMTAELVVIKPGGFEPRELRRPPGPVLLALVNKSGYPAMTLRLERIGGEVLRTVELPRNRRRLSIPITLSAGRYRIVDLLRPEMSLSIVVTP